MNRRSSKSAAFALFLVIALQAYANDSNFVVSAQQNKETIAPQGSGDAAIGQPKQNQAPIVQNEAPVLPPLPPLPPSIPVDHKEAYKNMVNAIAPLTPEQIRSLHQLLDEQLRARSEYPSTPPKPVVRSLQITLEPGETPPILRLSAGSVTSIYFQDITGASWPITHVVRDPSAVQVDIPSESVVTVSPLSSYVNGNISVFLRGLETPVVFTIVSSQKEVDYRVDASIRTRGPNAKAMSVGIPVKANANPDLVKVLDGITPDGARTLKTSLDEVRAWKMVDGRIALRMRHRLLSPAWEEHLSGSGNINVYAIREIPVILISKDGKPVQVNFVDR